MIHHICSRMTRGIGVLATALAVAASSLAAQTGSVTGRITDAQTGLPVPSAQVFIADLDLGVLTQQNGSYNLQNVPAGTQTLTVQRLGYREVTGTLQVSAGQTVIQDFEVTRAALQLDEVIVTGTPGGTQRRALGNAVARLDATELTERAAIGDLQDLLAARAPGVQFQRISGNVGGGSGIQIRGVSSLELGAQPLVYVDGIRIDNDQGVGPEIGTGRDATPLNDINPADIESIEIVKGPAAATLYGTEASAGVIQIITKRGQAGEPEFSFSTRQGTNFMVDPAGKIGTQYYCQPLENGNPRSGACPDDLIRTFNIYEHERDFNGNEIFGYGYSQNYNLSVRGGTEQVRYYLSGDWSDEQGIVSYNWDNRTNFRGNMTVLLTEGLTIDVSTGYVEGETRFAGATPGDGGVWQDMVWAFGYRLNSINTSAREGGLRGFQEHTPENVADVDARREFSRFTGSLQANHTYGGWLTQRLIVGLDRGWDTNSRYTPLDPNGFFPENARGEIFYERPQVTNQTLDYAVNARYQLTDVIGTTTSFGAQYNRRQEETIENTGSGFGSPLQRSINQTTLANLLLDYTSEENKSLGFYIQEEVSLNDRLFLTGAVRADDNSTFGEDFDLVYYPKVSGAWVVSEEDFWGVDFINSFRVRAAWGEAGRQPSVFAARNLYTAFPGPGGRPGLAPDAPGNPNVGPERTSEIEWGFDIAVLDERLSAEFTYFDQTITDALTDQALPPSFGFPGQVDSNLGELKNWGWEIGMDARVIDRANVALDLAAAGSYVENQITFLGDGILESANFQLGHPYPSVVGARVVSAELDAPGQLNRESAMCDSGAGPFGNLKGGPLVRCVDIPEQQILYGPAYPKYTVSFAPTLTLFNDIQVFALAEGQYGRWVADIGAEFASRRDNSFFTVCKCNALVEAAENAVFDDERYFGRVNADFWKMREIGVRYSLPGSLVQRVGADRASISASARNPFTIWQRSETDYGGKRIPDPEINRNTTAGANASIYEFPGIASVSVTMRVTF